MRAQRGGTSGGFTLLETIVTLVVLAFVGGMGAMAISGTNAKLFMARASLDDAAQVRSCMEKVVGEFERQLLDSANTTNGSATNKLETALGPDGTFCDPTKTTLVTKKRKTLDSSTGVLTGSTGKLLEVTVTRGGMRLTHVFGD